MIVKHIIIWMIVTILVTILMPLFIDGSTYKNKIKSDQHSLAYDIGTNSAEYIILKADRVYKSVFEDSGLQDWAFERYQVGKHSKSSELLPPSAMDKVGKHSEEYMVTFFLSMYEATFRITQLFYWALFALPFVVAAAFDGLMQRKVRILTFQYSSPVSFNTMWHYLIILTAGTFIYCNLPFSMPALIFPFIVFAAALGIRTLLANVQRSA